MKKLLLLLIIIILISCKEDTIDPTFEVTSFEKILINDIYYCTTTIEITNIIEDYSIDGILYADDITRCWKDNPYNEDVLYDFHKEGEGKYYFNLYGKHKGNMTIKLGWVSKENKENYLIGWHLTYRGDNYETLIVNLDFKSR